MLDRELKETYYLLILKPFHPVTNWNPYCQVPHDSIMSLLLDKTPEPILIAHNYILLFKQPCKIFPFSNPISKHPLPK